MEKTTTMGNDLKVKVQWSLTDRNMGLLERAGLAGLYLSLTAADEMAVDGDIQARELKESLDWHLEEKGIELCWDKNNSDLEVLTKVVSWAWQIKDGIYYLPGIHRDDDCKENGFLRIPTHSGLSETFIQYTGPQKPKLEDRSPLILQFDNDNPANTVNIYYRRIKDGQQVRQPGVLKSKKICPLRNKRGALRTISMPGWCSPGSAKRFGKPDQEWTGTTDKAFLLLFAPIACFYMKLPKIKAKKKLRANWAFLVPEIKSFETINNDYKVMQNKLQSRMDRATVSSIGDAGLRFAAGYAGKITTKKFPAPQLYIVVMGTTDYYSSSPTIVTKIRKDMIQVRPDITLIKRYQKLIRVVPDRFVERAAEPESDDEKNVTFTHYIFQPSSRGRIADNLINDKAWYLDIGIPPRWQRDELEGQKERRARKGEHISLNRLWFRNLQREGRNLMELTKEEIMWKNPQEQMLLSIFHANLRRLLNKEEKALTRGGSRNIHQRWEDRVDKIRRDLMSAKTLPLARKFLMEFLAEGGGSKELTNSSAELWNLVNHPYEWKKARDLAMLALVTFTDKRLATGNPKREKGNE